MNHVTPNSGYPITFSTAPIKAAVWAIGAFAAIALLIEALVHGAGDFALVGVGFLSLLATSLPLLNRRRFQPFEPIVLLSFSVLMGCALRAVMLAFSSSQNYKVIFLTDGMSNGDIAANAAWVPLSLLMLSIGYMAAAKKRFAIERLPTVAESEWSGTRLAGCVFLLCLMSLLAIIQLYRAMGVEISDLARLSVKRALEVHTSTGSEFAQLGYLNWMAGLAKPALFAMVAWRLTFANRQRVKTAQYGLSLLFYGVCAASAFVLSITWPFLSSSRSGILQVVFGLAVLLTYLGFSGGLKLKKIKFVTTAFVTVVLATVVLASIGVWRQYAQLGELRDKSAGVALLNNTIGSGNFLPLERTALIIDRMSERGDWFYGRSYISTIFAPVPRVIWHDKPVNLEFFVMRELYGRGPATNGYPPGLLGEAFINFGVVGLIVIPLLAGVFLKVFFNSFAPLLDNRNRNATLLYALVLWPVAFSLADLEFTAVVVNTITGLVTGVVVLLFVSRRLSRPQRRMSNLTRREAF